jgi:EAL domain-containing protein (putative c-di-GMP-specific phosphodiesterase class I)
MIGGFIDHDRLSTVFQPIFDCRETVFRAFAQLQLPGKRFIDASLDSFDVKAFREGQTLHLLRHLGIGTHRVVIELAKNQRITDFPAIYQTLTHYPKPDEPEPKRLK